MFGSHWYALPLLLLHSSISVTIPWKIRRKAKLVLLYLSFITYGVSKIVHKGSWYILRDSIFDPIWHHHRNLYCYIFDEFSILNSCLISQICIFFHLTSWATAERQLSDSWATAERQHANELPNDLPKFNAPWGLCTQKI